MTDDSNSVSRRNVLAGLGAIGVGGAIAGAGTSAYFSDEETFDGNQLVAGELDLKIDWQQMYYGPTEDWEFVNAHPDHDNDGEQSIDAGDVVDDSLVDGDDDHYTYTDNDGKNFGDDVLNYCTDLEDPDEDSFGDQDSLIELDDVKPGDCGELTFSLHLCDNPGWVWLGSKNVSYGFGDDDSTHLADEIDATLWYDLDANNELDGDEPIILDGSLRGVLERLNEGLLLDGKAEEKSQSSDQTEDECIELEKIDNENIEEYSDQNRTKIDDIQDGDTFTFSHDGDTITITVEEVLTKENDGEVIGFEWSNTEGICFVRMFGGGSANTETYDCATTGTDTAPETQSGNQAGLSNFTFWYCPDRNDGTDKECFTNSTTKFVSLKWCLPEEVGNEVQTDDVTFDLQFYTEQCRHNDEPENPWGSNSNT